jgi:Arc/MetJ-type ribon-helix-helix transcriptional regulator
MMVNLHLVGEAEAYVEALVRRGLAASKTEAVRLCIVKCRDSELALEAGKRAADGLHAASAEALAAGRGASKFYEEKYGAAKKR